MITWDSGATCKVREGEHEQVRGRVTVAQPGHPIPGAFAPALPSPVIFPQGNIYLPSSSS